MLPLWLTLVFFFFFGNLCTRNAPNDQPGLIIYTIWVPRRERGVALPPPETMTLSRFLRLYISLFIGIVCTSSVSLFLLVWVVNDPNISVDSLHHDFQTVYVLTTDQWSRNPQLRTAVELRWLWAFLSIVLTVGLFPNERLNQLLRWLAPVKVHVRTRTRFAGHFSQITLILIITQSTASINFERRMPWVSPCVYLQILQLIL